MMIELITKTLKNLNVEKWKIVRRETESREFFFVRDRLDMDRAKEVEKYEVTVYRNFSSEGKEYMGSSTVSIHPTMDAQEVRSSIEKAFFASKFVKNEPYPLVSSYKDEIKNTPSIFKNAQRIIDSVMNVNVNGAWLNSSEFFLNSEDVHILNSNGVDVSFNRETLEVEFITNAKSKDEEIELYWDVKNAGNFSELSLKIEEALKSTLERAKARPTPKLRDIPVIFDVEGTKEFLSYYLQRASALNVYEHVSDAKIGEQIQGDPKGSTITLYIDPNIENSYFSRPFDDDGFKLKKTKVIDDGMLIAYWGNVRFSHYLKVEPSGEFTNFVVESGEKSLNDLKNGKYVELKSFSDFQVNPITGDFAGEIRLGWYHDGKSVIAITGGSVSGNVKEVQEDMEISAEIVQDGNYVGPKALKILNAKIAGVN